MKQFLPAGISSGEKANSVKKKQSLPGHTVSKIGYSICLSVCYKLSPQYIYIYIFLTTFYGLSFSHHYTYYKHYNLLHVGPLWAAFIYCLFSLKNSCTCRDLNPRLPRYQADMLPAELSWLGSFTSILIFSI